MENNKFYRIIRRIIKPITNCLWPVKIINANKFVEGKGIYVCNHFTMLDPVPFVPIPSRPSCLPCHSGKGYLKAPPLEPPVWCSPH